MTAFQEKIQSVEDEIVENQHEYFLESSGLRPFLDTLKHRNNEVIHLIVTF